MTPWRLIGQMIASWRDRRIAFSEMRRMTRAENDTLALSDANPLHRAQVSLDVGDKASARHYLALARERIPAYVESNPDTIEVLLGLEDFAECDAFALAGAKRYRRRPEFIEGYALSAERRPDLEEAVRRWAIARKKFPYRVRGYVAGVGCLRQLGRFDEAEALLRQALRQTPDDIRLLLERGRVLEARGDWNEAYQHWISLQDRHFAGIIGAAQALHKLGRTAEAEALLVAARPTNPIEPLIPILYARLAEESGNKAEAVKRWAFVRDRFPLERAGYIDGMRLLREQREWAEADAIGEAAVHRFPADEWPLVEYAFLAQASQDWPESAKRWAAVRAAFPDRKDAPQREADALARAKAAADQRGPDSAAASN